MTTVNPLAAYGDWLATVPDDWPDEAVDIAYRQFIDVMAAMVPGGVAPVTKKIRGVLEDWGRGDCSVVASTRGMSLPWAALLNATAAHALDFDDNFDPAKAHISCVMWPAILNLAEDLGSSGAECMDAYLAAIQIVGRIGQGVNPPHRKRGWHATATIGVLGTAAAAARLLKLDSTQSAMAISLATSLSGGFMSQFGTMAKPLHAGNAARGGIQSAYFARAGVDAGWHTLDGPTGMNTLMVGPDREQLRAAIREPEHGQTLSFETDKIGEPLLIVEHRFRVKRFPTCGSAHRSLDVMSDLMEEHGFGADEVERIEVHAPAMHLKNLMYTRPNTELEGKFSIEYPLACLLISGNCSLADFTDKALQRPAHRALFERIHRFPIDRPETEVDTTLRVTLRDGRTLEKSRFMPRGSKADPYPTSQYWRKFDECTGLVMRPEDRRRLKDLVAGFLSLDHAGDIAKAMAVDMTAPDQLENL
ncbi:MAG: MmgE/PrpD family protein [Gammaproteobacteria bacterium]|nr:MAG: MmgE/PrpD family protein [Gammaproteobacteria bacterium]